jgi:4-carboxymuconolactone decarboxylase
MQLFRNAVGLLLMTGIGLSAGYHQGSSPKQIDATKTPEATTPYPKDIFPDSGNRLPLIQRDDLDEAGKQYYDSLLAQNAARSRGESIAAGPQGIRLYSPRVAEPMNRVNQYLRNQAGLEPKLAELAILVSARAMDNQYEWTAHESLGLKAGLSQATIDLVKHRKPVDGLDEKEAAIIRIGREALEKHKVSSDSFATALRLFGKQGLVNYVSLMCHYSATASLLTTFDQQLGPNQKPTLPLP